MVSGGAPRAEEPATPDGAIRIAVVTHGQASSPFWAIVRNGVEAAARQMDVLVDYQAPEVYDIAQMRRMVNDAIASRPDGLVVSIPEEGIARSVRRAVRAGIAVVSINSGSDDCARRSACSRTSASSTSAPGGSPAASSRRRACATRSASTSRSATPAPTPAAAA